MSRVRFHEMKERHLVQSINRIYRFAKFDLMDATRAPLSMRAREDLYEKVAAWTRAAIHDGTPLNLAVEVPGSDRLLCYEIAGLRGRRVSPVVRMVFRSPLANRLHRFVKAAILRRPLDLNRAIHGRHLPFGLRLEVV
jgi:hypothetical protein